jgi:hypothetical protein
MAHEAAERFRRYTNCHCLILTGDGNDAHALKFAFPLLAGGRVMFFFDSDLFFIRQVPVSQFVGMDGLAAVPDPAALHDTFCRHDAENLVFPPERYVNTGMMIFNSADSRVIQAFDRAGVLMAEKRAGLHPQVEDVTEQSMLNLALHQNQLPTQFLPQEWNCYLHAAQHGHVATIPAKPYCIHAAGVPLAQKHETLKRQCAVFEHL